MPSVRPSRLALPRAFHFLAILTLGLSSDPRVSYSSDVFNAQTYGYSCFRVPTAVQLGQGDVLVFTESRRGSCSDQAPKDVTFRRSRDFGRTWGPHSTLIGEQEGNTTFRNPYAVVTSTGDILVQFVNSTVEPWVTLQTVSKDDGLSWSPAQPILFGAFPGILGGPGAPIVLGRHSENTKYPGRIVGCGASGYNPGHPMYAVAWYSDDNGKSYKIPAVSAGPSGGVFANYQECQMAELSNGTLVINMRNSHLNPCDCRAFSTSNDGGATWTSVGFLPDLVEPTCSAGLINSYTNNTLFFSNPAEKSSRSHMTVKSSVDDGQTWSKGTLVWANASAYSQLLNVRTPTENLIGLVFERSNDGSTNPYDRISFVALAD